MLGYPIFEFQSLVEELIWGYMFSMLKEWTSCWLKTLSWLPLKLYFGTSPIWWFNPPWKSDLESNCKSKINHIFNLCKVLFLLHKSPTDSLRTPLCTSCRHPVAAGPGSSSQSSSRHRRLDRGQKEGKMPFVLWNHDLNVENKDFTAENGASVI